MPKWYKNRNWLYNRYIIQEKSIRMIAEECKCSKISISYHLDKFNIKKRSKKDATKIAIKYGRIRTISVGNPNNWIGIFANYSYLHKYMHKILPIPKPEDPCYICGKKLGKIKKGYVDLMNIDSKYDGNNLEAWKYVHHLCHMRSHAEKRRKKEENKKCNITNYQLISQNR